MNIHSTDKSKDYSARSVASSRLAEPNRSMAYIQPKLTIGQPNDQYEQEADRVADQVVRASSVQPGVQRKCAGCEQEEKISKKPQIQRMDQEEEQNQIQLMSEEELQTRPATQASEVAPAGVQSSIQQSRGSGSPLPASTRSFMESQIGADFSKVRIHTDSRAQRLSTKLNAQAFATGNDIYFNKGKFNPDTQSGKHLLAHELTHTVQQRVSEQKPPSGTNTVRKVTNSPMPSIQRSAIWAPGKINENVNLADYALKEGTKLSCFEVLNSAPLKNSQQAANSVIPPTVKVAKIGKDWTARISAVNYNIGSYIENVATKGPWKRTDAKYKVKFYYRTLHACGSKGKTTFSVKGLPNDNAVYKSTRKHEDHHAKDHEAAFKNTIVPWDKRLTRAMKTKTVFKASTAGKAKQKLWKAMKGTPKQIGAQFHALCDKKGQAFHNTSKGRMLYLVNPKSSTNCSTSSVEAF